MKRHLIAAAVLGIATTAAFAQEMPAATNPATAPGGNGMNAPSTQPAGQAQRSMQEVVQDLQLTSQQLGTAIGGPERLFDKQARMEDADSVLPVVQRMRGLMEEASAFPMLAGQVDPAQMDSLLVLYGDKDAENRMKDAADGEGEEALNARVSMMEVAYIRADDEAGRLEVIEKLADVAGKNSGSERVAAAYAGLAGMPITKSAELAALKEGANQLSGPMAVDVRQQIEDMEQMQNMPAQPEDGEMPDMENPAGSPQEEDDGM